MRRPKEPDGDVGLAPREVERVDGCHEFDADVGMPTGECRHARSNVAAAERLAGCDPEFALDRVLACDGTALESEHVGLDLSDVRQKFLRLARERVAVGRAREKPNAHIHFERFDPPPHGRVVHLEFAGCPRERSRFGQGEHIAKVVPIHTWIIADLDLGSCGFLQGAPDSLGTTAPRRQASQSYSTLTREKAK